jgi:type IV secretion system protein VirD4
MNQKEFFLGKKNESESIYSQSYDSILLIAPDCAGKGVCFVIPNLLNLEESCIVHDIKLENHALTSNHRASHFCHQIFLFDPLNESKKTHCYNPFDFISDDQNEIINDLEDIADLLISKYHSEDLDGINDLKNFFISLVLYLKAIDSPLVSIGEIFRILLDNPADQISKNIEKIKDSLNIFAHRNLKLFLGKNQDYQDFLVDRLIDHLSLWKNPLIDFATSKSDFDLSDLKSKKITIYVGVHPIHQEKLKTLLNFFYNHAAQKFIKESQKFNNSYQNENNEGVCFFLDDFSCLGKAVLISSYLPYLKGYKIRLFLTASNLTEIQEVYNEKDYENILGCCTFKVIFTPNNFKTSDALSKICIDKKKNKELFSWQEMMNFPIDCQIILMQKNEPIICKKNLLL